MSKSRIITCLLLVFLFAACDTLQTPTPTRTFQTKTAVVTHSVPSLLPTPTFQTLTSTPEMRPNPTLLPPTSTSTHTTVPPVGSSTQLKQQCVEFVNTLPESESLSGTLVLEGDIGSVFLLNLETSQQTLLNQPDQNIYAFQISPSQKWVYYTDSKGSWPDRQSGAYIASLDGILNSLPYRGEFRTVRWLDNERLIFNHDREPYNSVIVLNPFTGEEHEIVMNLPNPYFFHTLDNTQILLSTMDPSLSKVIYFDTEGIGRLILWDVTTEKMLAWLPFFVPDDPTKPPPDPNFLAGWSPNGSRFMTVSPVSFLDPISETLAAEELFSISLDGQVEQLTHLSAAYEYVRISLPHWSPDGRYIAFWLQTAEHGNDPSPSGIVQQFSVLDTMTNEIWDYCIPFGNAKYSASITSPVWAPNSQQIIIRTRNEDNQVSILLVDLNSKYAFRITENKEPVGWMLSP